MIKAVLRCVTIKELLDQGPEGWAFLHGRKSSRSRSAVVYVCLPRMMMHANRELELTEPDQAVLDALVTKALALSASAGGELERSCWMVVHEHAHGVKPTEYDIREIDEQLYLKVLETSRSRSVC